VTKRNRRTHELVLTVFICWLASCAHYPRNAPLQSFTVHQGYRYPSPEQTVNQDPLFIALAFSGGGTRAAALSYGVLKRLAQTSIPGREGQSLLDEVDLISSVSGGSFTAAYYGLFKERIFQDFESRFLFRNIQNELVRKVLRPGNWFRLLSPTFSRIDLAAELYHKTVFDRKAFQALVDGGSHPYIAINATNMTTGERFTFTQDQFDLLSSDLASCSVARAVAASSAFPFLLSPITLVNHEAAANFDLTTDIKLGLEDAGTNERRYLWAKNRAVYHLDKQGHPYLHLMDGGLADNLGLRYITDGYRRTSGFLAQRKGRIKHLVVIVVNAKTQPPENLDSRESAPGLKDVAYKTATVSLDNYTFETIQMARELFTASDKAHRNVEACQNWIDRLCGPGHKIPSLGYRFQAYVIEINFQHVKDPELRERFLALPTTFYLKSDVVRDLIAVGGELLDQSPQFQDLLRDLAQGSP
jgi:NTE family protein